MSTHATRPFRRPAALLALVLSLLTGLALMLPRAVGVAEAHAGHAGAAAPAPRTDAQRLFHDQMRRLWEDHATWTRLAIVTFAADAPGFDTTAARLLLNQADIGDAIKPFYGDAAGTQLTALLHDHITIAVEVMAAARMGDQAAFADARTRWYANGNDVADFLAGANPRYWPQDAMRSAMATHLDQTLSEAAHELAGEYDASISDYEQVHGHILMMADTLSAGIIGQFPDQLR